MYITPTPSPLTPHEAALRLARTKKGLAWLDGGLTHGREGRFSFVGTGPTEVRTVAAGQDARLCLAELGAPQPIEAQLGELAGAISPEDVPRWIGRLSYQALEAIGPRADEQMSGLPGLQFAKYDALYAFDHEATRGFVVGDDRPTCERLLSRLAAAPEDALQFEVGMIATTAARAHCAAIERALAHIREGDIYQINLARCFEGSFTGSALGLFLRMRDESPVPLGLYLESGAQALLGCSMERFLRFRRSDGSLWTSPIKGTLKRSGEDDAEAQRLRADPKEHAEHAMIVDLMRNDLGRVAHYGSVEVAELMAVLPFAGLSHLVSTVCARAPRDLGLDTLLHATFPPGSVTGTPKRRAMEIIAALEPFSRGVYTGAYGFIDRLGGLSLAVAIRTAATDGRAGSVRYFAGGGIVEASDAQRETAETELKAQVFTRAIRR